MNLISRPLLSIALLLVLVSCECFAAESAWPKMREFDDSFLFETNAKEIEFIRPLHDVNGAVRYVFVCRGGTNEDLGRGTGITYVGPLGCRLGEGAKEIEFSLLAEDDSAPWYSRGQYSFQSLLGDCGKYPEYGSVRHFRLRGFQLTLSATDIMTNDHDELVSFRMNVSLRRDDGIISKQAEQPGYLPPGYDCKTVKKGNLPRMCRYPDTGYIWEKCRD